MFGAVGLIWFGAGASSDQLLRLLVATMTTGASLFGLGVAVGSLALGARQPGMLMLLLMLPLGLPALIIFQASVQAIMESLPFLTLWGLQAGLFLMTVAMALVITPFSIRQAIR
jgi:ABC-type transport system involved in cytochrome c biogenesis permease component